MTLKADLRELVKRVAVLEELIRQPDTSTAWEPTPQPVPRSFQDDMQEAA